MGASRPRQTRAVVSYKLDSSSEDSEDDKSFTLDGNEGPTEEGRKNEIGITKGRRSLALKKTRCQKSSKTREEERDFRGNSELAESEAVPSLRDAEQDATLHSVGYTSSFQHLVKVASEAVDLEEKKEEEEGSLGRADGERRILQQESQFKSIEERPKHNDIEVCEDEESEGRNQSNLADFSHLRKDKKRDGVEPLKTSWASQKTRSSSRYRSRSDDDDWCQEDGIVRDSSESTIEPSSGESDLDISSPSTKHRQNQKAVVRKRQRLSVRTSAKAPKSKRSPFISEVPSKPPERAGSCIAGYERRQPKTATVRKSPVRALAVNSPEISLSAPRPQSVKVQVRSTSIKDAGGISSLKENPGRPPTQFTSNVDAVHRRVLGLSKRCKPPPLHPYLAGM